jgi:hypothetical protein
MLERADVLAAVCNIAVVMMQCEICENSIQQSGSHCCNSIERRYTEARTGPHGFCVYTRGEQHNNWAITVMRREVTQG